MCKLCRINNGKCEHEDSKEFECTFHEQTYSLFWDYVYVSVIVFWVGINTCTEVSFFNTRKWYGGQEMTSIRWMSIDSHKDNRIS